MTCAKCNTPFTISAVPEGPGWGQQGASPGWGQAAGPRLPGALSGVIGQIRAARLTVLLLLAAALFLVFLVGGIVGVVQLMSTPMLQGAKKFQSVLFLVSLFGTIAFFILSALYANVCLSKIADGQEGRKQ
jgi:hypothetical protein